MAHPSRTDRPAPPRTPYEEAIAAIWRDVLGRADIGIFDDFFDLNANSLHAIQVVGRIRKTLGVEIPVRDFFEAPTVAALAATAEAGSASDRRVVTPRPPDAEPVLSFDQQRLWLENQLLPGTAYNVHGRRRLVGPLDVAALEASLRAVIHRHEVLRTRFPLIDNRPAQVVDEPDDGWRLTVEDLTGAGTDAEAIALRRADEDGLTPFDLATGPLMRCQLFRLTDTSYLLSITMHHIISDAWSVGLFVREVAALYEAGGDVDRAGLPPLPVQYRDYAVWQRRYLAGDTLDRQVSFWRQQLQGAPPALALPTAQRRSAAQAAGGGRIRWSLSPEDTTALHKLCREHDVTAFMALLACLATVLSRWVGQPDVVIGIPVASRTAVGIENLIGFFVNTLPLRLTLSGDPTFTELLGRVRQAALDGYAHIDAPFDVLVKEMQVSRDRTRTPLFQAMLNVIDNPERENISGVSVEAVDAPVQPSKFDLALTAREAQDTMYLELDYHADRYQTAMMEALVGHLDTLLRTVVKDPGEHISGFSLGPAGEAGGPEDPSARRPAAAPHVAADLYAQLPPRVAVADADGEWSYQWLSQAVAQVAGKLTALGQQEPATTRHVGIVRRPSAAFVAVVLASMKAGVTFSVLEPAAPGAARFLGVSVVLDVSPGSDGVDGAGTLDLSALRSRPAEDPGPAGPAPGAEAPRPDAPDWAAERFGFSGGDRLAVLTQAPGHILSAVASAFSAGAALVIPDPAVSADIGALSDWLRVSGVTVAYLSPPLLRALAGHGARLPVLRYAFITNAGDLLGQDIAALAQVSPQCRGVGVYRIGRDGYPLALYPVPDGWQPQTAPLRIPLGTELPGAPAQLRHPSGQAAAIGEIAELWFGEYRTGDLARRWPDGTLDYAGADGTNLAADAAETVAALRDLPGVWDAVVTEHVTVDGTTTRTGYVAGPDPEPDAAAKASELRQRLARLLPDYLIPGQLLVVSELPLTGSGDYDLSALPEPLAEGGPADSYAAPRTPMEGELAGILEELLAVDQVGIHDSFFELGGFSLLATRLTSRIRETFDVDLPLRAVFESPTVEQLAQLIVRTQGEMSGTEDLAALLDEIGS